MQLEIYLHNWRCFSTTKFTLPTDSLVIIDNNGSGKTSLISAIYSLFTNSPFPYTKYIDALKIDSNYMGILSNIKNLSLTGELRNSRFYTRYNSLVFNKNKIDKTNLFLNKPTILTYLPIDNLWLSSDRKSKLQILDIILGQVFEDFNFYLKKLNKLLKIKNIYLLKLKNNQTKFDHIYWSELNINIWQNSLYIWKIRQKFFHYLEANLSIFNNFLNKKDLQLKLYYYCKECDKYISYDHYLKKRQEPNYDYLKNIELLIFRNLFGAQRDDFWLEIGGQRIEKILSKGEMRILVLAIKHLAIKLSKTISTKPVWWFLDDALNELDVEKENIIFEQMLNDTDYYLITGSSAKPINSVSIKELMI